MTKQYLVNSKGEYLKSSMKGSSFTPDRSSASVYTSKTQAKWVARLYSKHYSTPLTLTPASA